MRKVTFLSQAAIELVKEPHYVISIGDKGFDVNFQASHKDVLKLEFDDIEQHIAGYDLFDYVHGRKILDYIKIIPDGELLLIHCQAGISRSAAVAKYLNTYCNFFLVLDYPCCGLTDRYNGHVYGVLRLMSSDVCKV